MRTGVLDGLFIAGLLALEIVAIFMYGFYFKHVNEGDMSVSGKLANLVSKLFPNFQDVHIIAFFGFSFLLTSFHKFRASSIVQCFWVSAISIQFYILWRVFWSNIFEYDGKARDFILDPTVMVRADFCALAMTIIVSATMGKVNDFQYLLISILGTCLYALNESLCLSLPIMFGVDDGGAMIIHTFAAFFGIGISLILTYRNNPSFSVSFPTSFNHQIASLIATLFIWCYMPSFNSAAVLTEIGRQKAILNTYFAMIGSVVLSYATSKLVTQGNRFSLAQLFHSSLSGGIVVAALAQYLNDGFWAYIFGGVMGILTTAYFRFILPRLEKSGTAALAPQIALHAFPGVLGGLLSAIVVGYYTGNRGATQVGTTFISLFVGLLGGVIVGLIVRAFHDGDNNDPNWGLSSIAVEDRDEVLRAAQYASVPHAVYTGALPHPAEQDQGPRIYNMSP